MKELFLIITAYLIGSIPTALIISKHFFGVDIREYGSGNMGATNTFRVLGSKFGTIVMIGDMLKGVLAVALFNLLPYYLTNELDRTNLMIGLGLAAVAGHIYPIWAQFRGGKGVATLFGMLLPICVLWIYNEKEVFYRVFAVAVSALVVLTHQKNISRLLKGNENRVPILKYRDRKKLRRKDS